MSLSDLPGISSAADSTAKRVAGKIISFDVQLKAINCIGAMKAGDEISLDHFEIERSFRWTKLEQPGKCIPQLSHEYFYTDLSPDQGINYYRC